PELLNGIDRRLHRIAAIDPVYVHSAVQEIVIRFGTLTVHSIRLTRTERSPSDENALGHRCDAGLEQPKLPEIATVQRKIDELLAGNDVSDRNRVLHQRGLGNYVDGLLFPGDLQANVEPDVLADADGDGAHRIWREPGSTDRNIVVPGWQDQAIT